MRIQIAARRCEVPEPVKVRAEERIRKMVRYEPHLSSAQVVFEVEGHSKRVEAVLSTGNRAEPVVARGEGETFRSALDAMLDRMSRILRRRRDQIRDRKGASAAEAASGKG
jgi:ribosomal subunit interface protein